MTSSSLVLLVCTEVETLRRSGETMEISFRANSRCYSPSVLNMEAGDIEGFLFVLSSYNPPSLKMKPNWNFSILKSKASLNLDSSLVKRIHDTSQKLVGGKVSVGGQCEAKKKITDLGEISRTGKSYRFKFSSKPSIYLGKSFFLAIILRKALVTVPACLRVPGLALNAAPLVFWEQSRLNKG